MPDPRTYFAHTLGSDRSHWEALEDHLELVANGDGFVGASGFAEVFNAGDWGKIAGLWHDLGKYSEAFQRYLADTCDPNASMEQAVGRVNHSSAGAIHAANRFAGPIGHLLAYVIAGHHAGLADWESDSNACLKARLRHTDIEPFDAAPKHLLGLDPPSMPSLRPCKTRPRNHEAFQVAMFGRMLFSCLVDADFVATERFMSPEKGVDRDGRVASLEALEAALTTHLAQKTANPRPSLVNKCRKLVLEGCRIQAMERQGFFSLTVPTGGGKTLSSLAFALRHANQHGLRRVIYAIPYTSIIEQTAETFREALGAIGRTAVVEHHTNLDPERETAWSRLAAENWDAPIVVTTNVQLFESLFASRTSRCRKLHNIVRSVIILDEAQTLPADLLEPCLAALDELVRNYGCTIVLCTATQPSIERRDEFKIGLTGVREIIDHPSQLYTQMKRVKVDYIGEMDFDTLADRIAAENRSLTIVHTRPQASRLYQMLGDRDTPALHLSASMCAAHRSEQIAAIRSLLDSKAPCHVVSTSLVEAGVDLDFPIVYRAIAGLDSIAQAAGRCNREGKLERGRVYVFDPPKPPPLGHHRQTAETAKELLHSVDDLLSPLAIRKYFDLHYWKTSANWDHEKVMECFQLSSRPAEPLLFNYRTAAERFRFIKNEQATVIVPWGEAGEKLIRQLDSSFPPDRNTRRALQRYTVQIPHIFFERLKADGDVITSQHNDSYHVLVTPGLYKSDTGLSLDGDRGLDPASLTC